MFPKPKHTVESVTRQLIEGLKNGTVVLHDRPPERFDREDLEKAIYLEIVKSRHKARIVLLTSLLTGVMSAALAAFGVLAKNSGVNFPFWSLLAWVLFVTAITFAAIIWQVHLLVRTRETATELKTFRHVLEVIDQDNAERLAPRVKRKLPERPPAPAPEGCDAEVLSGR